MKNEKVYSMSFAKVYPLLVNKAVRKDRTTDEVDQVIQWLTGYDSDRLKAVLDAEVITVWRLNLWKRKQKEIHLRDQSVLCLRQQEVP